MSVSKKFFGLVFTLILPASSFAVAPLCQTSTKDYSYSLEQDGADVLARLSSARFMKMTPIRLGKDTYQISGAQENVIRLQNVELGDVVKNQKLGVELTLALVMQRGEFEGDKDLLYPTARDLFHSLKCK